MSIVASSVYLVASVAAGVVNTIAGGGSFLTFPALLFTGLDPRAANITSTIALYPMQISTGFAGRKNAGGTDHLRFRYLFLLSLLGGAIGAALLLLTPPLFFGKLVPWFILFATGMFAWGSFFKKPSDTPTNHHIGKWGSIISQFLIGVYGGYFGAGIGILMLASLTVAGMSVKKSGATKNILAAVTNTAAVLIFLLSKDVAWAQVAIGLPATLFGGYIGLKILHRVNDKFIRTGVVVWGTFLAIAFFLKG